jgi:CO/xanthine dehydrogenase Mo-binding subunit/aerobic-type carbon monoxide dehydrogenase small subunit (CoxS/CutS family)
LNPLTTEEQTTEALDFKATINGQPVELNVPADKTLLDVLREDLDLTGAKKGCDIGTCGSCAVIIDGKAQLSCIISAEAANGTTIESIESLEEDGVLHPLQDAFIKCQGFQCGVCTTGFIMSAKALLDRNPDPSDYEIRRAIKKNICRCTGYEQLHESIKVAAGQCKAENVALQNYRTVKINTGEVPPGPWTTGELKVIGHSHDRIESRSRVTGEAKYTADLKRTGMLWATTVRAPYAHAELLTIDSAEAMQMPGVVRVLTADDIPGENRYGKNTRDQQVFVEKKVRYYNEPVALVVAETKEASERGARAVDATYKELPVVTDPVAAMADDAPRVHEKGNVLYHYHLDKGNVDDAFAEADLVVENDYSTHPQDHSPMESEACLCYWEDGKLVVVSPGQSVFFDRLNVCRALGMPKDDVRCLQPAIGAAYGKREDIYAQIHCALATLVTGLPVKMEYSREETMLVTTKRTQLRTWIKTGVKKDGTLVAVEARVVGDAGAYASWSPNIMRKAGVLTAGPYKVPNVRVDSYAVYTNNPMTGATRGFGAAEAAFCTEANMDWVAEKLGIDPLDFRRKNALRDGESTATDFKLDMYVPVVDTIDECRTEFGWDERLKLPRQIDEKTYRGYGMATIWYGTGFGCGITDTPEVIIELTPEGKAILYVGTVDYGNGSNTTFAMMAAETLGLTVDDITIVNGDSARTLNCGSTVATKQTYTTGNAVINACAMIRTDIFDLAAAKLGLPWEKIDIGLGYAYAIDNRDHKVSLVDIAASFAQAGRPMRRQGRFKAGDMTGRLDPKTGTGRAWFPIAFGTQMVEIDVNVKTGKIKVNEIAAAHYVGRVINPAAIRGQIVGGISFGWGYALSEDSEYKDGIPQNINFDKYKLMRSTDAPLVKTVVIEKDEKSGPFGAIGIGEPPTLGPAPAIANALYDAVGIRIRDLPLTPEKVKRALALQGKPNPGGNGQPD